MIQWLSPLKQGRKTQPPNYSTEGTLLTVMKHVGDGQWTIKTAKTFLQETEGIGTEATIASIIETLKKQDYITISRVKSM